ncbi:hypothetical protein [Pseudonocardia alaniniphila]|uniref:Uncharacterized protein n=1 Tax=Pseudonocardia alaniniphila TaxID=75291 RepID=A0ABS9TN52_9PSEU|nr:hypothetical protein [Pseudonocardia alaniniphila]MCH6169974.1 hypothetical protein [Pseudonocardia alaniniphila]
MNGDGQPITLDERGPAGERAPLGVGSGARSIERAAYLVAALLVASGLAHLGVLVATGSPWLGPVSLRKALTFGLSFGLTLAAVTRVTSPLALRPALRTVLLGTFTAVSVLETALVTMQAWRGVPSHLNFATGFDTAVSMTLAAGGGLIIVTVLGFAAGAVGGARGLPPSMRLAVRSGFTLLVVGLAVGGVMIGSGVSEARTGNAQLAYSAISTLKPVHGVALHAILVLPALAWALGRTSWSERRRVRAVAAAAVAYATMVVVVAIFTGL